MQSQILEWARETAGLSTEEAARRIGGAGFPEDRLVEWESGESRPTVVQLRKMAEVYRRPLAVFFLTEPPRGFSAPRDFRRLPGDGLRSLSPELLLQLRRAQERREIASELYDELSEVPAVPMIAASLRDNPEVVGAEIRRVLKVTMSQQETWRDRARYKPLAAWRKCIEDVGVLVFQFTDVETSEALGFSIVDGSIPVVAVNRKLKPNGRIFSMMHEFVHVALRIGGLCDMEEALHRPPEEQLIEVFCNHAAAAALVPATDLLALGSVASHAGFDWADAHISDLSDRFSVSREVIVRRLLTLGRTNSQFYSAKRAQYAAERAAQQTASQSTAAQERSGFESPASKALSTQGPGFVRLVLQSYHQGHITLSDVSNYLGVRTKHLPRIERAVLAA